MTTAAQKLKATMPRIATCASLLVLGAAIPLASTAQQSNQQQSGQRSQQNQTESPQSQQRQSQSQQSQSPSQRGAQSSQSEQQSRTQVAAASSTQGQEKKSEGPNPYAQADDSWITINGTVGMVISNQFTLDYGEGTITVEMDDRDLESEANRLRMGDKVTVNGVIDDDFFETTKVEASSVYVDKLGRHFFASALDEEDFHVVTYLMPVDEPGAAVHGLVTAVSGDEFTIDNGIRSVRVDVDELEENPLDNQGYQKIEVGDVVRVTGSIDNDFFESREIMAESVTTLVEELG